MFNIFPKDDNNQALRIKRLLIALGSYVMWSTLAVFLYFQEHTRVTFNVLIISLSGSLAINIILYAMIRTGLNKRFKDPSLTLLQIVEGLGTPLEDKIMIATFDAKKNERVELPLVQSPAAVFMKNYFRPR